MAKRLAKDSKKFFSFDLESVFDLSQEEKTEVPNLGEPSNNPKKPKSSDVNPIPFLKETEDFPKAKDFHVDVDTEENNDYGMFFENIGNDFSKSIQGRKAKLNQFADSVVSLYEMKVAEMLNKMEEEVESFKEQAANNIQKELDKFHSEFNALQLHENKLLKILEQQIKLVQTTAKFQQQWSDTFATLHNDFLQGYKDLKKKHQNEALELKKSIESEVIALQNKFISESKKEEMQTMKSYINSFYF